jgi:hypothetical protein
MGASDIFYWKPDYNNIETGIQHKTLVSPFESGKEQRRSKWAKPKYTASLTFMQYLSQRGVISEIWDFVVSMAGQYDYFWLPSFKHDTFMIGDYTGGTTIYVDKNDRFSAVSGAHGNYIYITDGTNREVKQISSLASGPERIILTGALANSYIVNNAVGKRIWIQVAYKVRFAGDEYSEKNMADFVQDISLVFIEVF